MLNELECFVVQGGVKYLKDNSYDNLEMGIKTIFL